MLHITVQIFIGLDSLHKSNFMYKDLKASHVFVDQNLRVTLIDFGMCEEAKENGRTGSPAGTFHAMSQQMLSLFLKRLTGKQVQDKDHVGFEHDFFTVGVLLFEFLFPQKVMYFSNVDLNSAEGQ